LDNFIFVQILGIITLILFVISLQQRKKETFLLLQIFGTLLFIVQYILTGKITGAIIFTIVAVRGLVFYYYKKKDLKPSAAVLAVFQIVLLISTYFSWQNMLSIIPYIATAVKTWGTWQDDMKWTRRASLFCQSFMIVYNLSASMYTGALTEVCALTSTIIAMWRYDFRRDKSE
jgi:membrane-bound ClpP family serine protease